MATYTPELVEVSVWAASGDHWEVVGSITYDRLDFAPRHLDVGVWTMTVSDMAQATKITPGRLITTLYRGELLTWAVNPITTEAGGEDGSSMVFGGFDALSMLGWEMAWPEPSKTLENQAPVGRVPTEPGTKAPAETVIRTLVLENFKERAGHAISCPPSDGRGGDVVARPKYDNLLDLVMDKARAGDIGVRLGLVSTDDVATRATLTLGFYKPRDRTMRVHLDASDGSLESWSLVRNAPTATKAIVSGMMDEAIGDEEPVPAYVIQVTTPASEDDAADWGGHRVIYVEGPETFDREPLEDAGTEALKEGKATTTLTMAASEPEGTYAFRDFSVGDRVTAMPVDGLEIADVLTSIQVEHEDGGIIVTPTFGDPDADYPEVKAMQIVRSLRREARRTLLRKRLDSKGPNSARKAD